MIDSIVESVKDKIKTMTPEQRDKLFADLDNIEAMWRRDQGIFVGMVLDSIIKAKEEVK